MQNHLFTAPHTDYNEYRTAAMIMRNIEVMGLERLRQLWTNNKAGVMLGILTVMIGVALLIFAKKLADVL